MLYYEINIMTFLNAGLIFTQKYLSCVKRQGHRGGWESWILIYRWLTIKTKNIKHTILETFVDKNPMLNLARFHGGF